MISSTITLRVRYSETDQMGFVYYGNYAQYLEIARVEMLRELGVSYKELEERGYALPVKDLKIDYKRAATYDDELIIKTEIREMPNNKIRFHYTINRDNELLVVAETTLFFIDSSRKACRPPDSFVKKIKTYFS